MINPIQNQRGIALISTLMLLVLGLGVVAILLRLTTQETKLARLEQGYATALDAAKGATDAFITVVQNQLQNSPPPFGGTYNNSVKCLQVKMKNPKTDWSGDAQWSTAPACPSTTNTTAPSAINPDPTDNPDMTFTLGTYAVNLKIIDTWGTANTGVDPCPVGCWYYTVVARAQDPVSGEHADTQFMFRFSK